MAAMDALELKIPPPLVTLACVLAMWAMPTVFAPFDLPFVLRLAAAIALLVAGLGAGFTAVSAFKRAQTTVSPLDPGKTSALVTSGVFRFTRNPMYLGLLALLTGWAVYLDRPLPWLVLPVFVLYLNRFQIGPEERILKATFGEAYAAYAARVRRWL